MASHLKTAQESAIRGGAFSYGCFCTVSCRAGLICCVFFPRVQCCARRGKPSCPNSPSCYTYLSMPCSFLFCIMRRRRSAASAVSFHVFSSSLPYVFGTRVAPAIYLCSLSPVCLRRLLSRSDGRWGVSASVKPIQPGDEAGLFGKSRWAMAEGALSDRVFCFQAAHAPPG